MLGVRSRSAGPSCPVWRTRPTGFEGGGRLADPALAVNGGRPWRPRSSSRRPDAPEARALRHPRPSLRMGGAPMPPGGETGGLAHGGAGSGGVLFVQHRRSSPIRRPGPGAKPGVNPSSVFLKLVRASLKRGECLVVGVPVVAFERLQQAVGHPGGGLRVQLPPCGGACPRRERRSRSDVDRPKAPPVPSSPTSPACFVTCASIWRTPS